jgi:CRISPR-associated exonuclease Cas4
VPIWSDRLGLIGKSDIIEWHGETPYPVEYKVGKKRNWGHEVVQLCAQAMCLAEMLEVPVPAGAIYYVGSRRRREIVFSARDISIVESASVAIRGMLAGDRLPDAIDDARCPNCSLIDACTPAMVSKPAIIRGHYSELFHPQEGKST